MTENDVLWDVAIEHLDEGGFAFSQWRHALASPLHTLNELAHGPEEKLLAHVDALSIHGQVAADRLLVPEIEAPESPDLERSVIAALVLLRGGRREAVWNALSSSEMAVREGAREGLVLDASPELGSWILERLAPKTAVLAPGVRAIAFDVAARRGHALPEALEALRSEDPEELSAAVVAARMRDPERHSAVIEQLTEHPDRRVRVAAVVSGLCIGSAHAWRRCLALAADPRVPEPLEMQLVALLGGPRDHEILVEHLSRPSHRAAALAALGWTGQAALVPVLLPLLASEDPATAKRASLAFACITGVDTTVMPYVEAGRTPEMESLPPLEEEDLDADLVPAIEESFPAPDAEAIADCWRRRAGSFEARCRLLAGTPWTLETCLDQLERASLHTRRALALWLLVRSGGAARLSTDAWSDVQRGQQVRLRTLSARALTRRFGDW